MHERAIRQHAEDLEKEIGVRTAELAESERRYKTLVEEMNDGYLVIQEGRIKQPAAWQLESAGTSRVGSGQCTHCGQSACRAQPAKVTRVVPSPSVLDTLKENPLVALFVGSHVVVRIGVIVLFFGVAFLLKVRVGPGLAFDPTAAERRCALGVGARGGGLAGAGARRRTYGLTLQGAGLGIAYMTVFVAFRRYGLLPTGVAMALLVAIGVACAALSVVNNAMALAVLAITGGFAAPILI